MTCGDLSSACSRWNEETKKDSSKDKFESSYSYYESDRGYKEYTENSSSKKV